MNLPVFAVEYFTQAVGSVIFSLDQFFDYQSFSTDVGFRIPLKLWHIYFKDKANEQQSN